MTSKMVRSSVALLAGAILAYFEQISVGLIVLLLAMTLDYITGLVKAYFTSSLSSKIGLMGILKKGCYLLVVCAGAICDWVIGATLQEIGFAISLPCPLSLLIAVWLVVNEMLSVLENLSAIGVPMPKFLRSLVKHLAAGVENSVSDTSGNEEQEEKEEE